MSDDNDSTPEPTLADHELYDRLRHIIGTSFKAGLSYAREGEAGMLKTMQASGLVEDVQKTMKGAFLEVLVRDSYAEDRARSGPGPETII